MTTLSEFRSTIRSNGNFAANDTRVTDAVIDREINRALRRIALVHDWPWLQKERTITMVSGLRQYALPDDFLRLLSVRYSDDTEAESLWLRSIQELDEIRGEGKPRVFAVWGGKIHFAATPSGAYTVKLRYVQQEAVLVNDTDVPLIPDYWNDGVIDGALVELMRLAMRPDEAGLAEARFQVWLKESRDNILQTRGAPRVRVRPGGWI